MNQPLFRPEALRNLHSPEQLDILMTVTSPKTWVALLALGILLGSGVAWAFLGWVPTRISGTGMLIRTGGILEVESVASGQIVQILVDVGDLVERDQLVAVIAQPQLSTELAKKEAELAEVKLQHETLLRFGVERVKSTAAQLRQQRLALRENVRGLRQHLAWLGDKLKSQEELYAKGLIARDALQKTRSSIDSAKVEISTARTALKSASVAEVESESEASVERQASELRIRQLDNSIALIRERLEASSRVASPSQGRVLELRVNRGTNVAPGVPILSLDPLGEEGERRDEIEALLYVVAGEGKKVKTGMEVQIAPATVNHELYGFAVARVDFVSEFPASRNGMLRVLGNEALVDTLAASIRGAPLMIRAKLLPDDDAPSGYQWSSGQGPDTGLSPGTPCGARITIDRVRPIDLVIPAFRTALGG